MTASGRALTETVRGKVAYMSPEQARGERPDARVDLWAVGVVFWELLAGEPLFSGTTSECLGQLQHKNIPRPSYRGRSVPPEVEAAVARMLARSIEARFRTADDALRAVLTCVVFVADARGDLSRLLAERVPDPALRAAARTMPQRSARPGTNPQPQVPKLTTLGSTASQPSPARPRRKRWLLVAALVAAGAVASVFVAKSNQRAPAPASSDPVPVAVEAPADAAAPAPAPVVDAAPALVVDATPVIDAPVAKPEPAKRRVSVAAKPVGKGWLVIRVKPWADVWIDGKRWSQTPFREQVPAGVHKLKLFNEDSKRTERIPITIKPDETLTVERNWL
jgi:serine/threonine-protein kinase